MAPAEPEISLVVPLGKPDEYLAFGKRGVAFVVTPQPRLFAWVQIRAVGQRLEVGALYVKTLPGFGVRGRELAKLRLGLIETVVNSPTWAESVRILLPPGDGGWIRGRLEDYAVPCSPGQIRTDMASGWVPAPIRRKLAIPTTRTKPDEFYKQVAELHAAIAGLGGRPAIEIAEANGVPTSTVYRWLKEARRRGILPPTRRANQKEESS